MTWLLHSDPGVVLRVHGPWDATRPVAVVLHGVGSTADFALRCLGGPLGALGYDVVAPDLRGHAGSTPLADPAAHAVEAHVGDVSALAAEVDVHLVAGISLGAEVALRWVAAGAGRAPDGVVVCLPGIAGPASTPAAASRAAADLLATRGVDAVLAGMGRADGALPWVVEEVRASWPQHHPTSLVAALRAAAEEHPTSEDRLRAVGVPVGVVAVDGDAGHPSDVARHLVERLPCAALTTVALADLADDRGRLGRAGVAALARASGSR